MIAYIRKQKSLENKVVHWQRKLDDHKETCPHLNLTYKQHGSSGNWDHTESYWTNWFCDCCGKHWTTDQGEVKKETIKKFPHAKET